jgi:hypothetical protein
MSLDANHRVTPSTLVTPELDVAQERVAGNARATKQERPRQVADPPTSGARRPEMRIALFLRFGNGPGAPVVGFHRARDDGPKRIAFAGAAGGEDG